MPDSPYVRCFTFPGLTVASASGYTEYVGSRERVVPMCENEKIAAVESVADGLLGALQSEFRSPIGGVETRGGWLGEDFYRVLLVTPSGGLSVIVTSVVGEEGADVRVVILDSGECFCSAQSREMGRVARAVAAAPAVDRVWADTTWRGTFFASVRWGEVDS